MTKNVLKLWKAMLHLAEIVTDKANLIIESELAEGIEVFVEKDGEIVPAEDGEYVAEDNIIVVADGKISEIRDKEVEEESEPQEDPAPEVAEELSAKDKFNAVKAQFEASYQEVEKNIYSALENAGIWGYLVENTDSHAVVSIWGDDNAEHLYRYEISIDENGYVTLGEREEVRVEYVPVDQEPEETVDAEEFAKMQTRVAELEAQLAEKQAQLEMSADEPAKSKVKKETKSGALRYFE